MCCIPHQDLLQLVTVVGALLVYNTKEHGALPPEFSLIIRLVLKYVAIINIFTVSNGGHLLCSCGRILYLYL